MMELIVNPVSGRGRALKTLKLVEAELIARNIAYHVSKTENAGHATELTKAAITSGANEVAVLGGDGLLSEVCQALMNTDVTLYFVPCGTGNDFIRSLNLPKKPVAALRLQLDSPRRRIDCGLMNEYAFMNIAGVGFDIEVLQQTERFKKRLPGIQSYIYGLIVGLKNYKPFEADVEIDGHAEHGRYTIIAMANGQFFGGGMRVAPKAQVDDGTFDVMIVTALPKWKFYLLVPLFSSGLYTRFSSVVRRVSAKEVCIRQNAPFIVEVDGELKQVPKALFMLQQGSVLVRCP